MKKQIFKVKMAKSTFMLEVEGHFFTVSAKVKVKRICYLREGVKNCTKFCP